MEGLASSDRHAECGDLLSSSGLKEILECYFIGFASGVRRWCRFWSVGSLGPKEKSDAKRDH